MGIRLLSIPASSLYSISAAFWLVLVPNLVLNTDLMIQKLKVFVFTTSKSQSDVPLSFCVPSCPAFSALCLSLGFSWSSHGGILTDLLILHISSQRLGIFLHHMPMTYSLGDAS